MDLREHLLALVAPHRIGDRIGPGVLLGVSVELGLRLTFDAGGQDVHVEVALADESRRYAARTARLHLSYRVGDPGAQVDPAVGLDLCRAVASIAAPHEARVLAAIAAEAAARNGDASPPGEPAGPSRRAEAAAPRAPRIREVVVDRLLEPAGSRALPYYTLSPYVGCLIGCRFCYAQERVAGVRRLEGLPDVPWGSYVDARVNAAEVLARELPALAPLPVKFCPIVSDPYQAAESRYGITRACLEAIAAAAAPPPTIVLTRARLIERDADVLAALPRAYAGASIPTDDDDVRRHFEPRASSIAERLAALRRLRAAGVRTFAVVQPLLPGSIAELAAALADATSSVSIDVLRGTFGGAADFDDPRYRSAADPAWQRGRAEELAGALSARGVAVWEGDLPPDLSELAERTGDQR